FFFLWFFFFFFFFFFFCVADEPGKLIVEDPLPPVARVNGIQCSTAHITEKDNALLFTLSHQYEDFGESEWILYTGSGSLLHLEA
ncbi:DUF5983 family protein, partial [Salmonella enterica]|uniref:DUF5983 family protein n=1 Tax=Salmonella enterica TaxID=28901 RepID=UPI000A183D8D